MLLMLLLLLLLSAAIAKLFEGVHQRRDGGAAGAVLPRRGLQHGDGGARVRRRGRPAVVDPGHGLLLRRQQRGQTAEDEPGAAGDAPQHGHAGTGQGPADPRRKGGRSRPGLSFDPLLDLFSLWEYSKGNFKGILKPVLRKAPFSSVEVYALKT